MLNEHQANHTLNIGLHVIILFTFLTIFFFFVISKLEQKSAEDSVNKIIDKQADNLLSNLDKWDKKISGFPTITWGKIKNTFQNIVDKNQGVDPKVESNHKKLHIMSACMIGGLILLWIGAYFYFSRQVGHDINLKRIAIENLVIFAFVGIIEYGFFTNIASKYVPVTPDFAAESVLDRVKYRTVKTIME